MYEIALTPYYFFKYMFDFLVQKKVYV